MEFCHISPTKYLTNFCSNRKSHLVLAHLIETDQQYVDFYLHEREKNPDITIIMDNSAFEMYKQDRPMYPGEKLIEMGQKIKADYIVMSDFPGEDFNQTIDVACQQAPLFKDAGFGTFFVPQTKIASDITNNYVEDLVESFTWALFEPLVDYIGVSIIAIPNAYGVEKNNNLQRFLSRYHFLQHLDKIFHQNLIRVKRAKQKKIHFLGMVDGPNEISLIEQAFPGLVDTWDSSSAVWAGLNGISYDASPTGLINGKFEEEVDFDFELEYGRQHRIDTVYANLNYIEQLINRSKTNNVNDSYFGTNV